jgi:hypothetical protein
MPSARGDTDVILLQHPRHTARNRGLAFNESDGRWCPTAWLAHCLASSDSPMCSSAVAGGAR